MPLFQVAVVRAWIDENDNPHEMLLVPPTAVVAKDNQTAMINAILKFRDEIGSVDSDELEILVVPFV